MKSKLIFSLLLTLFIGTIQAQKVLNNKKNVGTLQNDKALVLSKKFDFSLAPELYKPGYIRTKWVPYNSANREMKVTEKAGKTTSTKDPNSSKGVECNTVTKTLDVNSASFMSSNADLSLNKIYPGAIYPANDFIQANYNREVQKNRTPVIIRSQDSRFGKSITINQPNENNIGNAITDLKNTVQNKTAAKNLETKVRMFYSSNEAFTSFLLSAGASGYGVKIDASTTNKSASSTVTLTIDAYKSIYNIDAISAGDNEYFTSIPNDIKASNLILVNSVSYGSRILANLTIECKSSEDAAKLAMSYKGYGFSAGLNIQSIKSYSDKKVTFNYKQVGGPNGGNVLSIEPEQLMNTINNLLNKTNYDNAAPISYSVRDLVGNNMGIQSTVDKYTETVCFTNEILEKVFIKIGSGKDGKNADNYLHLKLFDSNNNLVATYSQPQKMEFKSSSWSDLLPLKLSHNNIKDTDFIKGGKLNIFADHKGGKDDWYIDDVIITMYFADGNKKEIQWRMRRGENQKSIKLTTQSDPRFDLNFDKNLHGFCSNCKTP